ncbi:hypothetical protein ACPV5G_16170 [Photobacterium damselae]|uniref:hypothetical protein n=1 Tax=Photobacterium damselae TaxID=38293 RepID=UPI0040676A99
MCIYNKPSSIKNNKLNQEREKLEQSLILYRIAVENGFVQELPFLLKRIQSNQESFEYAYEQ